MPITIPNQEAAVGIPSQWEDSINAPEGPLFLSSHPDPLTMDYEVAASQTLEAFTVVGFDASKRLVPAVVGGGSPIIPIGVLAHRVVAPAGTNYVGAKVYRAGHFNMNRLVWPASFDTVAEKKMAFEGSPTPTQIRVGEARTYTP